MKKLIKIISFLPTLANCGHSSCNVYQNSFGAVIECNGTSAQIYNGQNGQNGINGQSGINSNFTIIKFCTDESAYGLVIDNIVYSIYYGKIPGKKYLGAYLTQISPGTYNSYGSIHCTFTINANGTIQEGQ